MPQTAAWIDEMREVFGLGEIKRHAGQRKDGKPTLHASENGHEIGTAFTGGIVISGADLALPIPPLKKARE